MNDNKNIAICYAGKATADLGGKIYNYGRNTPDTRTVVVNMFRHDGLLEMQQLGRPDDIVSTLLHTLTNFIAENAQSPESQIYLMSAACNDLMRYIQNIAKQNHIPISMQTIADNLNKEPLSFIY